MLFSMTKLTGPPAALPHRPLEEMPPAAPKRSKVLFTT